MVTLSLDGDATCFGGCTARIVRSDCGALPQGPWPTNLSLGVEATCTGGCAAGPGHSYPFHLDPATTKLRRAQCKTPEPGYFAAMSACSQANPQTGGVPTAARWVGKLLPGTTYVVDNLPAAQGAVTFTTAGVPVSVPCPEEGQGGGGGSGGSGGGSSGSSNGEGGSGEVHEHAWSKGHEIPYELAFSFESFTSFRRVDDPGVASGTFLGFGVSHGLRARFGGTSSGVRSWLVGDAFGIDWRARVLFGVGQDAMAFSHGLRPVLRVAGDDPLRHSSLLGALLPELGVLFHTTGKEPDRKKATSAYLEWTLVPMAYRFGFLAAEWDGVRFGLGLDGRWWSVATGLSLVFAPPRR